MFLVQWFASCLSVRSSSFPPSLVKECETHLFVYLLKLMIKFTIFSNTNTFKKYLDYICFNLHIEQISYCPDVFSSSEITENTIYDCKGAPGFILTTKVTFTLKVWDVYLFFWSLKRSLHFPHLCAHLPTVRHRLLSHLFSLPNGFSVIVLF